MLFLPLELIGAVVFLIRLGPSVVKIDPIKGESDRFLIFATLFLYGSISIFLYIVAFILIPAEGVVDFTNQVLINLFLANAHILFIGSMTSAIFALFSVLAYQHKDTVKWGEEATMIVLYIGLVGFVIVLLMDMPTGIAAVMGIGLFLGLLTYGLRFKKLLDQKN